MKRFLFSVVIIIVISFILILTFNVKKDKKLTKIKVAEVTHSIFYAPQYVAHSMGYFKKEGLDVDITLVPGADKVTAAVLSGDAQIGFCGAEATVYVYNGGEKDYLVNFAGLTKRDGSFIFSRKKINNFTLENLKGKDIIGGRKGGMPEMSLEWALKQNKIDPKKDVNIDTSIQFAAMSGAFIGGTGDFVTLFEPNALTLEKQGYGYVVASVGELAGTVPYTTYNAKKSYIAKNPKIIKAFNKAINKGLDFVHNSTDKEVAEVIQSYFPDTSMNDLIEIVKRYRKIDSWYKTTYIPENDYNNIEKIIKSAGEPYKQAPFNKLVNNKYSKK